MKYLLISCAVIICFSCKNEIKEKNNTDNLDKVIDKDTPLIKEESFNKIADTVKNNQEFKFKIETSINKIRLLDSESLLNVISNPIFLENGKSEFPELIIYNSDKTQKLTLLFYPGSHKNEVSYFILEKSNTTVKGENVFNLDIDNFNTNNDITLGVSRDLLENKYLSGKIKLNSIYGESNSEIMTYMLDDFKDSFLKKYNMPIYSAKYYLVNNKIVKIEFGFEYP